MYDDSQGFLYILHVTSVWKFSFTLLFCVVVEIVIMDSSVAYLQFLKLPC